jgi:uncharacterized protein YbjQ (UPF0145 family)
MTNTIRFTPFAAVAAAALSACLVASFSAVARNVEYTLPLDEVLRMPAAERELDGQVRFYLSGQSHTEIVMRHSEEVVTAKIRGAGEEEIETCKRAALKALVHYQGKARKMGANAIVDMVSYFDAKPFMSPAQYECHAGSRTVVVVFKGSYAKIAY